jgi:SOS response regulatory protein OraA/RecX
MATKLNKELNSIQKEIKDKTKVVNKLNTKTFSSFVVDEIITNFFNNLIN